jgi:hypothetical protein
MTSVRLFLRLAAILLVLAVVAVLWPRMRSPTISELEVRDAVFTAIQQEADTSFVITGYLEMVATTTAEDTRVLFPGILDLPLGTTRAAVQVPGRVSYGFDVRQLRPEMIHLRGDTVEVEIPELTVYSAEPRLDELRVQTTRGWARFPVATQDAERRAIRELGEALRRQGDAHLRDTLQPRVNTAETLRSMLTPVLVAVGIPDPYIRIRLGEALIMDPTSPPGGDPSTPGTSSPGT